MDGRLFQHDGHHPVAVNTTTRRKAASMRNYALLMITSVLLLASACSGTDSQPAATPAKEQPAAQNHGTLLQVMRGILFPNSNVIFAAQGTNPAEIKQASDPSTATDPLMGVYGGWTAVENAGIALAESGNLLIIPGLKCSNGQTAPIDNADWKMFVQGLRDAGMKAYQAGQSKNQDMILEASDAMTTACANCHDKYRDKPGGDAARCM